MEPRITSGRLADGVWSAVALGMLIVSGGCLGPQASVTDHEIQAARRQTEIAIRATRAEAAALRAEMAATRITAAKQEAELRELRRQLVTLRQHAETKQTEVSVLQGERDRLLQTKEELQAQLAELATLRQNASEVATLRELVKKLEGTLAARTDELAQIRKNPAQNPSRAPGKRGGQATGSKKTMSTDHVVPIAIRAAETGSATKAAAVGEDVGLPGPGVSRPRSDAPQLTVQPGDSLSTIAKAFGLTVHELKALNGLDTDAIRVGQKLVIPSASRSAKVTQ